MKNTLARNNLIVMFVLTATYGLIAASFKTFNGGEIAGFIFSALLINMGIPLLIAAFLILFRKERKWDTKFFVTSWTIWGVFLIFQSFGMISDRAVNPEIESNISDNITLDSGKSNKPLFESNPIEELVYFIFINDFKYAYETYEINDLIEKVKNQTTDLSEAIKITFNILYPDTTVQFTQKSIDNILSYLEIKQDTKRDKTFRVFFANDSFHKISSNDAKLFLQEFPFAKEYQIYQEEYDRYNVPLLKVFDFLISKPYVEPIYSFAKVSYPSDFTFRLWKQVVAESPDWEGRSAEYRELLSNEFSRRALHQRFLNELPSYDLSWEVFNYQAYVSTLSYGDTFKIKNRIAISNYLDPEYNWFTTYLKSKNKIEFLFEKARDESFYKGKLEEFQKELIQIDDSTGLPNLNYLLLLWELSDKYPQLAQYGIEKIMDELSSVNSFGTFHNVDILDVGDKTIQLPVPKGYCGVTKSLKGQLDIAALSVPEYNTLLAYYMNEEDIGRVINEENSFNDSYIFVQTYNEAINKDITVGEFKIIKESFKKQLSSNSDSMFSKGIENAEETISKWIDDKVSINNSTYSLGIFYESEKVLSFCTLSRTDFSTNTYHLEKYVVASVANIIHIDNRILFLYFYKNYEDHSDLLWLKNANDEWIKEIEKNFENESLFNDFSFQKFQEIILAILTLSFLGASYWATRAIFLKKDRTHQSDNL